MGVKHRDVDKALQNKSMTDVEKSLKESNRKNAEVATIMKKKNKKETWGDKLTRGVKELLKGEKTYISKERAAEMKAANKAKAKKEKAANEPEKPKTKRTTQTESALKNAGIDDEMMKRLRGGK
jgi:hypothetical protein